VEMIVTLDTAAASTTTEPLIGQRVLVRIAKGAKPENK
jgi:hypothetical protein